MKSTLLLLAFVVPVLLASTVEVGSAVFSSNKPFCAN